MVYQTKFSEVAAQQTLSETTALTANSDDADAAPTTRVDLLDRAQAHAVDIAAEHFPELPVERIEWDISDRWRRSAGATTYDPASGEMTISLAWDAYDSQSWKQFSSTVRHELIHVWQYHEFVEANHGRTFTRWTDTLDATQHCERFKSSNWWLVCEDCDGRLPRYRRPKTVRNPDDYSCYDCGGSFCVEEGAGQ